MARFSNFNIDKVQGIGVHATYFASVDVTTGFWFWKKTVRKQISRDYGSPWFFVDTGEFTPSYCIENLERVFNAQKQLQHV